MLTHARSVPESYKVISAGTLPDGEKYIQISCENYDRFLALPAAMVYDGKEYGVTGWNSDTQLAYYKVGKKYATKA